MEHDMKESGSDTLWNKDNGKFGFCLNAHLNNRSCLVLSLKNINKEKP